jgi:hypothetical protein
MQLFVEAYNQTGAPAGTTGFFFFSTARQYLPEGVKLASLTDTGTNVETGDPATTLGGARAILFDSTGSLVLRGGLFAPLPPAPGSTTPGSYADNSAYGDWKFNGSDSARSYPGFFLYNKAEFDAQPTATARLNWLKQNSSSVIVNGNTGGVLK